MNHESDDAMFEVLLAEAAGGPRPPDLTQHVLEALQAQPPGISQPGISQPGISPSGVSQPALLDPAAPGPRGHRKTALVCAWIASLAASIVLAGLFFSRPDEPLSRRSDQAAAGRSDQASGPDREPLDREPLDREPLDRERATAAPQEAQPAQAGNRVETEANRDGAGPRSATPATVAGPSSELGVGNGGERVAAPAPAPRSAVADAGGSQPNNPDFPVTDRAARFSTDPANPLASASPLAATIDPAAAYPPPPQPLADEAIVARIDALLASAWQSAGIEPTEEVDAETRSARLSRVLGTTIALGAAESGRPAEPNRTAQPAGASESIRRALNDPRARQNVSRKFARTLLGRVGAEQLSESQREAFARWLAPAVGGEVAFDAVAAELLTAQGSSDPEAEDFNPASVWLSGLAGPRSVPLVEQFGHAMLDLDLRCGRCHDHPLDGRVWQNQYWELNAVFQTSLRWSADRGRALRVEAVPPSARGADAVVFFELPDGRQRAVPPRVAWQWVAGSAESDAAEQIARQASELEGLAAALKNNPQLARAAVNRLWETVYGGPLIGSAADPSAPPESEPLLQLQAELAAQLRAHDFDLARALSWIAAAAPMRLQSPPALEGEQYELASDADLRAAGEQLRHYAAYPPQLPNQEFQGLVAMVQRWSGEPTALASPADVLLGQAADPAKPGTKPGAKPSAGGGATPSAALAPRRGASGAEGQVLRAIYDASAATAAVPWLSRVGSTEDFDERALHLFYLAGYWNPSARQRAAAESLRVGDDDQAALSRLWWILSREE